jgi:hypothetical protein
VVIASLAVGGGVSHEWWPYPGCDLASWLSTRRSAMARFETGTESYRLRTSKTGVRRKRAS